MDLTINKGLDSQGLDTGHPIYLAGTIFGSIQSANEILAFFITQ